MEQNYLNLVKSAIEVKKEIYHCINVALDNIMASDITAHQFLILKSIENENITFVQASKLDIFQGTNPSYTLNNLVKNGYITARESPRDRRRVYYSVSKKGKDLIKKVDPLIDSDLQTGIAA